MSLSVSLAAINSLQIASIKIQCAVTTEGAVPLAGSGNADGSYKTTLQGRRLKAFDDITKYTFQHLLEDDHAQAMKRSRANEALVGIAFTEAATRGVDFNAQTNMIGELSGALQAFSNTLFKDPLGASANLGFL